MKFKRYKLNDLSIDGGSYGIGAPAVEYDKKLYTYLRITDINEDGTLNYKDMMSVNDPKANQYILKKNDICFVRTGNSTGKTYFYDGSIENLVYAGFLIKFSIDEEKVNPKYIKYYIMTSKYKNWVKEIQTGSTRGNINAKMYGNLEILIPERTYQDKLVIVLDKITDKIKYNTKTNDNLSEQLKQIFNNKFYDKIQNNDCSEFKEYILYDVLDVIDNRGKTPKLVEVSNYPIIDVRAISGENRIIDYKQCQKYVDDEVYNTFFRSGHPKINDILISTVGSLAEMKIYMENKGTIAQNVVALRSKYDYPMYIYQYLKAIKNDLISYNIGSVQPSIKVTQFMKHNIYIPKDKELYEFENIAKLYTDKMFNISKENETLEQLRDTLLPKLMNGEIDLDKIEI